MYTRNELLFPYHAIPLLSQVRGEAWRALINSLAGAPEDDPRTLALMLLMIRLNGCLTCETDSFRAMRGCPTCALQTLRRFKGSDEDLLAQYRQALEEIQRYFADQNGAAG
ncbi:MAG: hypothetical protein CUN49_00460 [Candidatus Thermofonsia Clade 1 bacterium]|uniref:Uncharacterized protein n=1 Tax=Candidatus Thermofonsia Clade 1 bacterium TaxID=2364210 RepID=A0A2M8PIQ9_9CHLR|nr:MAG: hypothetical protein CUN49_00460 [Candidatus Thermofonsia Clade 1 bacterium]PJF43163.1 MAG: hypothetical protein CUN50_01085 [Candidatus Thermofonsia Clade 1 bacterium]RMF52319.1 MAG: hypothetical protein D6749_05135 [Chloroflexota bacterium]